MSDAVVAFVFVAAGILFVLLNMAVIGAVLRGPRVPDRYKGEPYECGETPVGMARIRFNPRFFIVAVVFVLFDIEIAFLFPWAVAARGSRFIALLDMAVFLGILLAGYLWVWAKGDLRWILPKEADRVA